MIRVLVNGSNGKMGQEVIKLISKSSEFYLFGGLDKCKKDNLNYRIYSSITDLTHLNDKPDVIVDFSVPDASLAVLSYAKNIKIPIVIATTGFSNDNQKLINECSKNIPIFQSANMSFDINIMKNTVANLATLLTDDDIEIVETHHNSKLDSPSGTAMMLADSINRKSGINIPTFLIDMKTGKNVLKMKLAFLLLEVVTLLENIVYYFLAMMKA